MPLCFLAVVHDQRPPFVIYIRGCIVFLRGSSPGHMVTPSARPVLQEERKIHLRNRNPLLKSSRTDSDSSGSPATPPPTSHLCRSRGMTLPWYRCVKLPFLLAPYRQVYPLNPPPLLFASLFSSNYKRVMLGRESGPQQT